MIVGVATTILVGLFLARRLNLSPTFGVLSGGSVAICGASAALAIASVLPQDKDRERDTILVVVLVTALSTLAMILYPVFATSIGLDHRRAGVFIGGTIHDVAQVVGAGYMISPETGDIATYVKLLRVAMLLPVVLTISLVVARAGGGGKARVALPLFLFGFAALVAVNSFGLLPRFAIDAANDVSRWCLVAAIAALGMKTSFKDLFDAGLAARRPHARRNRLDRPARAGVGRDNHVKPRCVRRVAEERRGEEFVDDETQRRATACEGSYWHSRFDREPSTDKRRSQGQGPDKVAGRLPHSS